MQENTSLKYVSVQKKLSQIFIKKFKTKLFTDVDYTLTSDPDTADVKARRFTFYENNITQGAVVNETSVLIASGATVCKTYDARIEV